MSLIKRAYRSRLSPTAEQCQVLARTFGCCRWVSNQALARKTAAYREAGQRRSYGDLSALLPLWKSQAETKWLGEVSCGSAPAPCASCRTRAFVTFFEGQATTRTSRRTMGRRQPPRRPRPFPAGWASHPGKNAGSLDIRWSRPLPEEAHPTTVTVSRDAAGRSSSRLLVEAERAPLPVSPRAVGIDLGLHDVVRLSTGEKTGNETLFCQRGKAAGAGATASRPPAQRVEAARESAPSRRQIARAQCGSPSGFSTPADDTPHP